MLPAEGLLIEGDFLATQRRGSGGVEFARHRAGGLLHLFEQRGADGEEVAAGEFEDFPDVTEARAHDLGLVAVALVVVVNRRDRNDAGVFRADEVLARALLVPVEDAAHERRDELHAGLGARDGLGEAEQQREIAGDAGLFEFLGGADALPS